MSHRRNLLDSLELSSLVGNGADQNQGPPIAGSGPLLLEYLPVFTIDRATANFAEATSAMTRSSITMVSAAVVALIIGSREEEPKDYGQTSKLLWDAVSEMGLKQAMVYKYLGLARQLARTIEEKDPDAKEIVGEILQHRSASTATKAVVTFLVKEEVTSLDKLGEFLGGSYQRTQVREHDRGMGTTAESEDEGDEAPATAERAAAPATAASAVPLENRSPLALMHDLAEAIADVQTLIQLRAILDARIAILSEEQGTAPGTVNLAEARKAKAVSKAKAQSFTTRGQARGKRRAAG